MDTWAPGREGRSTRGFDLRNTGGFSSGVTGVLRLNGDARIADDLELATLNALFGSQHPSAAWHTYHTPMHNDVNGIKADSAVLIPSVTGGRGE